MPPLAAADSAMHAPSLLHIPAGVLQVQEAYTELARSGEEMDILRIMLDTAEQQVREAKRKALNFELMAATTAVMASPLPPARAAGEGEQHEGPDATDREADQLMQGLGITLPSLSRNSSMAAAEAGGGWAVSAGHAALPPPISTAAVAAGAESVPMTPTGAVTPTASRGRYLDALVGSSRKQGPETAGGGTSWLQIGQGLGQQRHAVPEAAAGPGSSWSGAGDHQVRSQLAPYAGEIQLGKPPAAGSRGNSASNADLQKQFSQLEQMWASQLQQQQQQQPGRNRRSGSLAGNLPALPEATTSRGGSPVIGQAASRPGSRRGSPDVGRPGQQQQQRRQDQQQGQKGAASGSSPRLATPRGGAGGSKAASGDHPQQQQQEEEVGTREVDQVVKELYFSDDEVDQEPSSSPGETAVGQHSEGSLQARSLAAAACASWQQHDQHGCRLRSHAVAVLCIAWAAEQRSVPASQSSDQCAALILCCCHAPGAESDDQDADPDYVMTQPRGRRTRSRTSGKRLSCTSMNSVADDAGGVGLWRLCVTLSRSERSLDQSWQQMPGWLGYTPVCNTWTAAGFRLMQCDLSGCTAHQHNPHLTSLLFNLMCRCGRAQHQRGGHSSGRRRAQIRAAPRHCGSPGVAGP
jgi:hypothetical protein